MGGANLYLPAGPYDQRPVLNRPDVLLYISAVLLKPLAITGRRALATLEARLAQAWGALAKRGVDRDFILSRSMLSPATCCLVNPDGEKTVEKAFATVRALSARLREKFRLD